MGGSRVARFMAVGGCLATGMYLALAGQALAAPTPALTELRQAQANISALVSMGDTRAKVALDAAVADLAEATAESLPAPAVGGLWVDPSNAVPPPYGDAVFRKATDAVEELYKIVDDRTVSEEALLSASNEILEAEDNLAAVAVTEVQGLRTPPGTAEKKWKSAFNALAKQITDAVTSVPQATLEQAATAYIARENLPPGFVHELVKPITGFPPLTDEGKPEVFFLGSEGCPYCGVDRWSLVAALARFGRFSPLAPTVSSTRDMFPATHTLTFYRSKYKSSHVAFVPLEAATTFWTQLQEPTASELELLEDLHVEDYSFTDFANRWESENYANPGVIAGMSWQEIATMMAEPSSPAGQEIDFAAEIGIAQICDVDHEQPISVCGTELLRSMQEEL